MVTTRSTKPTEEPPKGSSLPKTMQKNQSPAEVEQLRKMRQLLEDLSNLKYKRVLVMAGAGISTASGIPDFRSPKTGLYANLQKFNLPYPEAVFDIDYLRENPKPFFMLCSEMYPTKFKPTRAHYFINWLNELGVLQRCYTQNIDTLERKAGVLDELIVEAHGSFARNFCIDCKREADKEDVENHILAKKGVYICKHCEGIVKPGIVFFGEALPQKFFKCMESDLEDPESEVDLVIVVGTSLQVGPFNQLPDMVSKKTRRVLINFDRAGSLGKWKNDTLILGKLENLDSLFDEYITTPAQDYPEKDLKVTTKKTGTKHSITDAKNTKKGTEKKSEDTKKRPDDDNGDSEITSLIDKLNINK